MNKIIFFVMLLLVFGTHAQEQNLLSGKYTNDQLKTLLVPQSQWTPFPKIADRAGWAKADQTMLKSFFDKGLTYINYEWPSIPATTSLLIERTGDRATFDAINSRKREVLGTLVLAEIYENKGRFTD